jgi:hypothetical protein
VQRRNFIGDNFVIRSWIHTFATLTGKLAGRNMLSGLSLNGAVCAAFELQKYQPIQGGLDRQEITI